jgi:DNA-binding transcriptional LysR family regulator
MRSAPAGERLTATQTDNQAARRCQRGQRHHAVPARPCKGLAAIRRAALNGVGAAMISAWIVKADLQAQHLHQLVPAWQAPPLPIYLLYPYASYYPARLRQFMALMREVMPGITGARPPGSQSA